MIRREGRQYEVDAVKTTTGEADITELFAEPAGVVLTKDSNQAAADNTLVDPVSWENASEKNSESDSFADLDNDQITIPNDKYSFAQFTCGIKLGSRVEFDFWDIRKNGSGFRGQFKVENLTDVQTLMQSTAWVPVANNDSFSIRFRQVSGGSVDINQAAQDVTFFEVTAI